MALVFRHVVCTRQELYAQSMRCRCDVGLKTPPRRHYCHVGRDYGSSKTLSTLQGRPSRQGGVDALHQSDGLLHSPLGLDTTYVFAMKTQYHKVEMTNCNVSRWFARNYLPPRQTCSIPDWLGTLHACQYLGGILHALLTYLSLRNVVFLVLSPAKKTEHC